MNDDRFEQHLREQPLRRLPPAWRAEILAAAAEASPRLASGPGWVGSWWRSLLWPSPVAWAGVAAAWLVIVGLNQLTPGPTSSVVVAGGAVSLFDFRPPLALQRLLEPEMLNSPAPSDPDIPKPSPRQRPRSGRVAPHKVFCA